MDKKFILLMMVFFVVFAIFISATLFNKNLGNFARASAETEPSPSTSLIFAWPLKASAGEKININIFIRNVNNQPLENKSTKLVTNFGTINGRQQAIAQTDKSGKVSFTLTANTSGLAELTAFVNENIQLSQKVTVKFE